MPRHRPSTPFAYVTLGLAAVMPGLGYALWALIGIGLASGYELSGRGEVLVQLALGLTLTCIGVLAGSGRRRHWRALTQAAHAPPSRERLVALASLLPMLGVAGLVRGSNEFWATRLLAAAMAAGCLLTLLLAAERHARHARDGGGAGLVLLGWLFGGGLWFRVCLATQVDTHVSRIGTPLLLLLMVLGLTAALAGPRPSRRRLLASLLGFVVPCVLLALASTRHLTLAATAAAAVCATIGLCLESVLARPSPPAAATLPHV